MGVWCVVVCAKFQLYTDLLNYSYQTCNRYSKLQRRVTEAEWLIVKEVLGLIPSVLERHVTKNCGLGLLGLQHTEKKNNGKLAASTGCPKAKSLSASGGLRPLIP